MEQKEVDAAIAEAKRFIKAAEAWKKREAEERDGYTVSGTREGGAMKRASLDLTMALAQMRKPHYRRK